MSTPARRFRELLARPGVIPSLGAHDVFSALLMEQAGLDMVFLGGFGAAASLLGLPDLNFLTQTEMADQVRRVAGRVNIPVIADADTGHGEIPQVIRTVQLFEQAGAAGLLLEDQVAPKRCGHFDRKQVITPNAMLAKLDAALTARRDDDFTIFARTDARAVNGLEDAIERANRYGQAGADVIFVEAPASVEELRAIAEQVPFPLLANMVTGGKTSILTVSELAAMGYKIVVAPVETLMVCARAMQRLIAALKQDGRVDTLIEDEGLSFTALKQVLGLDDWLGLGESKGG